MTVEIRPLQPADDRQAFRSGDRRYGFVPLDVVEGALPQRPEPTPMFLALGSVPRRQKKRVFGQSSG